MPPHSHGLYYTTHHIYSTVSCPWVSSSASCTWCHGPLSQSPAQGTTLTVKCDSSTWWPYGHSYLQIPPGQLVLIYQCLAQSLYVINIWNEPVQYRCLVIISCLDRQMNPLCTPGRAVEIKKHLWDTHYNLRIKHCTFPQPQYLISFFTCKKIEAYKMQ